MAKGGNMNELLPVEVFPPGEFLLEELEERGWSQREFAEILGRPVAAVNEIIKGKRSITPATAKELAAALGTSPFFWLNLEAAYQLHTTEPPPRRIAIEARLRSRYPVRDMVHRGWIEYSDTPEVLEGRVLEYFQVQSIEDKPTLPYAARKGATAEDDLGPTQLAWVFRVHQIANTMQVPKYSEKALREALPDLRYLITEPEAAREVPQLLEDCGVRLVIVEPLPGSKIDGVCSWLGGRSPQPVIGMTLRYDRIDNFWFVLRHELEHVLQKHAAVIDSEIFEHGDDPDLPEQERIANRAAAEFCVPQDELDHFIRRVKPLFSEYGVVGFAYSVGAHPGLVVGQLQHRLQRYNLLRKHLAKIRDSIVPSAMTDGYGQLLPI